MPDLSVETSLPKVNQVRKFTLLSFYRNCAYYQGAKPGKKYALNKQYALLSQLRLLTRIYGIENIQMGLARAVDIRNSTGTSIYLCTTKKKTGNKNSHERRFHATVRPDLRFSSEENCVRGTNGNFGSIIEHCSGGST